MAAPSAAAAAADWWSEPPEASARSISCPWWWKLETATGLRGSDVQVSLQPSTQCLFVPLKHRGTQYVSHCLSCDLAYLVFYHVET